MSRSSGLTGEVNWDDVPLETLREAMIATFADCGTLLEKALSRAVRFGRMLIAARKQVPHGAWSQWITETFADQVSLRRVQRYMQLAESADDRQKLIAGAQTIEDALRQVQVSRAEPARDQAQAVMTAARPASAAPTPCPSVKVVEPAKNPRAVRTAKPVAAVAELVEPVQPEASDSRRIVPMVQPTDEEIIERCLDLPLTVFLRVLVGSVTDRFGTDQKKSREIAEQLRKTADVLDPRQVARGIPDADTLIDMIPADWSDELAQAATDWAEYKQARKKDDRIQSVRAWEIALKQMSAGREREVVRAIYMAIANSWKGWQHESKSGGSQTAVEEREQATADGFAAIRRAAGAAGGGRRG